MEMQMPLETEAKLDALAQRTHRSKEELLEEAVQHLLVYNEWLERKVENSLAATEAGRTVSDEQVGAWLRERERS
jgi:predicted transcriptional regulator